MTREELLHMAHNALSNSDSQDGDLLHGILCVLLAREMQSDVAKSAEYEEESHG